MPSGCATCFAMDAVNLSVKILCVINASYFLVGGWGGGGANSTDFKKILFKRKKEVFRHWYQRLIIILLKRKLFAGASIHKFLTEV